METPSNQPKAKKDVNSFLFKDPNANLEERVEDLLSKLTIEEKCRLCSGYQEWKTYPIERLGIPSFMMTDGPHGVAPHSTGNKQSTYFPPAICMASTWNPDLGYQFGVAAAQEVRDVGFHMLLAPGMNIARTPLNGRTFEYYTEDPFLNKNMAVSVVKGLQSERISACIKHFICNNQETKRYSMSSEVSERALQEIYFPSFKACVEEADAWGVMACYNRVNNLWGCEHTDLIRNRLMKQWGFRGFVVSDWGATKPIHKLEKMVNAGLSLEMPKDYRFKVPKMIKALNKGKFEKVTLDDNVKRLLRVMILTGLLEPPEELPKGARNTPEHQALSKKIAAEGLVLLKNTNSLLPLDKSVIKSIAVVGMNADKKMSMGGGSSQVNCPYEITALEGIKKIFNNVVDDLAKADAVIVVTGLNHERNMDNENTDRKSLSLPEEEIQLILKAINSNPNTIVVLINGSPISMDEWGEKVPAIIEAWYGGMEAGNVIAEALFGKINPCGKLPITFPKKLEDSPAHSTGSKRTYPGITKIPWFNEKVYYDEDIFVGYRWFDEKRIEPLYPFGHGLSYTEFSYGSIELSTASIQGDGEIEVSIPISNTGNLAGAEVVQLYISDLESSIPRPPKELKGFKKAFLEPGEKQDVKFKLTTEDLSFFNDKANKWVYESGDFEISIGSSSRDIRARARFNVNNN